MNLPKRLYLSAVLLLVAASFFARNHKLNSADAVTIKNTLSSSQLSYFAPIGAGTTAGNTLIYISGSAGPSFTTNNLFVGDTVSIGTGGTMGTYIVKDVGNTRSFSINVGVSSTHLASGAVAIATRSAVHTVSFAPQSSIANGKWQVLIKAAVGNGETYNDGIPDQNGFDSYYLTAGAVTCPWGGTASVGTTTSVTYGSPSNTATYNVIECTLGTGITNPVGTGATGTIVIGTGSSMLSNPTPNHTAVTEEGQADTYTFFVRHADSGGNVVDAVPGKIAVIESVRVTVGIDPTLSFSIESLGTGGTACGLALSVGQSSVTATSVPFGFISVSTLHRLAQKLSVVTNGTSYVLTAFEATPLTDIRVGTTIPDTNCDAGNCSATSATAWASADATRSEFGYSLLGLGSTVPFTVANGWKPFGIGTANAQTIMSRTSTPTATDSVEVCYQVSATTIQPIGDYENRVTYTATATF